MTELPPDPPRLRAILAHLEQRIADNETIATYLRLQRDAVQAALTQAESGPPRRRGRPVKGADKLPALAPASSKPGFVVQQKRTPDGPEPATIHVADCAMLQGPRHQIRAHEARVALTDPNVTACGFCRPDSELGMLD